jgi:hypothetical protein
MVEPSRRHRSIQFALLIRILKKSDVFFPNQFSPSSIKGRYQPGCFTLPSSTLVSAKEGSTQLGSFIGELKQTKRISLCFSIMRM